MADQRTYKMLLGAIEAGGGGGGAGDNVFVVTCDPATYTFDKTWQEVSDADFPVVKIDTMGSQQFMYVAGIYVLDSDYIVSAVNFASGTPNLVNFVASSADGYPVLQQGS